MFCFVNESFISKTTGLHLWKNANIPVLFKTTKSGTLLVYIYIYTYICMYITSSLLIGSLVRLRIKPFSLLGLRDRSYSNYKFKTASVLFWLRKWHLIIGILRNTATNISPLFIFILMCKQITMLFLFIMISMLQKKTKWHIKWYEYSLCLIKKNALTQF